VHLADPPDSWTLMRLMRLMRLMGTRVQTMRGQGVFVGSEGQRGVGDPGGLPEGLRAALET